MGAKSFNQNIGSWNTSNVKICMVCSGLATSFNQNIGSWNTNNVTNMIVCSRRSNIIQSKYRGLEY